MRQLAGDPQATPLNLNTYYEGEEDGATWDEDMLYACVCDSSWKVGLGSGERQESEWFGPDCSLRHCPTGNDPRTDIDDTDCFNKTAPFSSARGEAGNLCHVDCSNRGQCDYGSGKCQCYNGYYGEACTHEDVLAKYSIWG
jgi:hypothetical protein